MRSRRWLSAALVGGLVLAGLPGATAAAVPAGPAVQPGPRVGATTQVVTLITGDRVTVGPDGQVTVAPRSGVDFIGSADAGHRFVIPSDALPLVRAGRLDKRLFDVTELLAVGAARPGVMPLIVSGAPAVPGLTAERRLPAVRGFAAKAPLDTLAARWPATRASLAAGPRIAGKAAGAATPGKIWLDGLRKPSLDVSVPLIGAPTAWSTGFDGTGVTVAVLDTGIDATHPDLVGKVADHRNFTEGEEDDLDRVGHGTHVASTIAGSGAASAGRYRGVAPGSTLLDGKICTLYGCADSWILAGMQWAAESGAQVVNMSLGGPNTPEIDPVEQAVDDLSAQFGTLFVVAAGNDGTDESVGSPATAAAALAVAATTKTDELADFSSRGPSPDAATLKPEIGAPGAEITAANSKDGELGTPGEPYTTLSGTSMATPHVVGAAAILRQAHPGWTGAQLKAALTASAKPLAGIGVFSTGAGRVDVARAITQQVTTSPAAISLGLQEWPHTDDPVVTTEVTYRNSGTAAVTLQLALTGDLPAGIFSLSAPSVTIPAGGTASVTLTSDTRAGGGATGGIGGVISATGGAISVQTPFGVVREELKHAIHLSANGRDGAPAENAYTSLVNIQTARWYDVDGAEMDLRLPPGTYIASTYIPESGGIRTVLSYPKLVISGPQTIRLDARLAKPFDITLPDPSAKPSASLYIVDYNSERYGLSQTYFVRNISSYFTAHLGPRDLPELTSKFLAVYGRPDAEGSFDKTPFTYTVALIERGSAMTGLTRHVAQRDVATIRTGVGASQPGTRGGRSFALAVPGEFLQTYIGIEQPLPVTRTDYLISNAPVGTWTSEWASPEAWEPITALFGATVDYRPGRTYTERFNQGVFGPAVGQDFASQMPLVREGDTMYLQPALFGDGAGRAGYFSYDTARLALYRGGKLVAQTSEPWAVVDVPAGRGHYRLEATATRNSPMSTRSSAVWTFDSATTAEMADLPLSSVSFEPDLDDANTARKGRFEVVPVRVGRLAGAGSITSLSVEVSTDDGATWRSVPAVKVLGQWRVLLQQPHQAGFVSLRATAADSRGNTVTETVIRAYAVR